MQNEFLNEVNNFFNEKQKQQETGYFVDGEIIRLFWNFVFEKFAVHFNNDKLKLSEAESDLLTSATIKWLNYRLPALMLKYSVDFEFALAILSVVSSKIIILRNAERNNSDFRQERTGENNINQTIDNEQ